MANDKTMIIRKAICRIMSIGFFLLGLIAWPCIFALHGIDDANAYLIGGTKDLWNWIPRDKKEKVAVECDHYFSVDPISANSTCVKCGLVISRFKKENSNG